MQSRAGFCALLLALVAAAPPARGQTGTGSVDGRVTNAVTGDGVAGASVRLLIRQRRGEGAGQTPQSVSFPDGSFHLDRVPAGTYYISATHPDYQPAAGALPNVSVASGQQLFDVALPLTPNASLKGKVTDLDGNPLGGIRVVLLSSFGMRGNPQLHQLSATDTATNGSFVFQKVAPGKYYVAADPALGGRDDGADPEKHLPGFVRTFFPSSRTLDGAERLELAAGQSLPAADLRLIRAVTYRVRGKVAAPGAKVTPGSLALRLTPRNSLATDGLGYRGEIQPDGRFDIARVPPGSYTLWLLDHNGSATEAVNRRGRSRLLAREDVDVSSGNQEGIELALIPPISLTGKVSADGLSNPNFSSMRVQLYPAGAVAFGVFQSIPVAADGSFAIRELDPGEYLVRVSNLPAQTYTQSVALNGREVMITGMDLSHGGSGELDIRLRQGAAEIDGSLAGNATASAVMIFSDPAPADGSGVITATPREDGTFALRGLRPGRYFIFAVDRWTSIWQNPDFQAEMERQASSLEVEENGHVQIQVPVLSLEEIAPVAARLGLSSE